MEKLIGKFLHSRPESPLTNGLVYKITKTRIYCVNFGGCDTYITIEDFNNRLDSNGNKFFWTEDTPRDTFWYNNSTVERLKKEKNIM